MASSLVPSHARWSFQAGASALSQFQFCALNSSGQLITPATTGAFAVVLDDAPSLAAATSISNGIPIGGYSVSTYYGVVLPVGCVQKVITGANLTPGVPVMTDASGHAVAAITGAIVLGITIQASNSGDIAAILLNAGGYHN